MSLVINTNIASLEAQDNLSTSQASLDTSVERLSSGLRINSAADDAAGLAIATRFTSQINGDNQAVNNANDAVSLAQTAEGSLTSITNNLQTIRQLAVQASNGTNSQSDRDALDTEAQQLLSEVNREANASSFNGVALLNGTNSSFTFQVGANTTTNDTITVSGLQNSTIGALGSVTQATVQGGQVSAITAGSIASGGLTINGTNVGAIAAGATSADQADNVVDAVNAVSQTTGVGAYVDPTSNAIVLTSSSAITVGGTVNDPTQTGLTNGTTDTSTVTGLSTLSLQSYSGSQTAINQIDSALQQINTTQATLGAVQNRFTSVVSNLQSTSTNLSAARSSIQDADFASETANLTQESILQQAGTAVLAQANSQPKNVLSLLQNL